MSGFRAPAASLAVMRMVRQRRLVPVMRHGARTRSADVSRHDDAPDKISNLRQGSTPEVK
jgi:hypothetical protein